MELVEQRLAELNAMLDGESQVKQLVEFFSSETFPEVCHKVFQSVDTDRTNSLDQTEVYNAFRMIMGELSAEVATVKFGNAVTEGISQLGVQFINETFDLLDADKNGTLDLQEFQVAAQLSWIEAAKIVCKAEGGQKLVQQRLVELAGAVGVETARTLEDHFSSQTFRDTCNEVFQAADVDKSETIDRKECFEAFNAVLTKDPGLGKLAAQNVQGDAEAVFASIAEQCVENSFTHLDLDDTNALGSSEFTNAMCLALIEVVKLSWELGGADAVVSDKMHKLDRVLSVQENQELKAYLASTAFDELCSEVFVSFDADGNGALNSDELLNAFQAVMKRIPGLDEKLAEYGNNLEATSVVVFRKKLAKEFDSIDMDGNGELDSKEFPAAMRLMYIEAVRLLHAEDSNIGKERVREVAEQVGIDIGVWEPLEELLLHFQTTSFAEACTRIWHTYDRNQTGSIDQQELLDAAEALLSENKEIMESMAQQNLDIRFGVRNLGMQIVTKVFAWIDVDKNGVLDANEFPYAIQIFYIEALRASKKRTRKFAQMDSIFSSSSSSSSFGGEDRLFSFKRQKQHNEPRKINTNLLLKLGETDTSYAQHLQRVFCSSDFEQACMASFTEIDADNSQSIDRDELLGAFEKLVKDIPGTVERFTQIGVNPFEALESLGREIIAQVFVHVDVNQSGTLDFRQFVDALKMMWLKLALAKPESA